MKIPIVTILPIILIAAAGQVAADELETTYAALMSDVRNTSLNLRYAHLAEDQGKLKWALPAYERALRNDPANTDARAGLVRVRAALAAPEGSK